MHIIRFQVRATKVNILCNKADDFIKAAIKKNNEKNSVNLSNIILFAEQKALIKLMQTNN